MSDEQSKPPFNRPSPIPAKYSWPALLKLDGDELEAHYRHTLEELGKQKGLIGVIFRKAQNKIQDPAKLRRLVADLIDKEEWSSLDTDVKGDAYEGLLQKNAEDVKGGAGQYFTPRPLIQAIVEVMQPKPGTEKSPFVLCDPACGTGGFLLAAHDYLRKRHKLDKAQLRYLNHDELRGVELVDGVARLCSMNLVLHGINGDPNAPVPVLVKDALGAKHGEYEMVLTNPPFGKKSSVTIVNDAGDEEKQSLIINRDDFWASTSNKQLNFLQHVFTILKQHGRAAIVVPDNILFEGGAGETVRRELLKQADVHTLLRLPTGIFYAQGVKANVLFFDRKPASEKPWTERLWIYDLRTNIHFTLKENPLERADLDDFIACYFGQAAAASPSPLRGEGRGEASASSPSPQGRGKGEGGGDVKSAKPATSRTAAKNIPSSPLNSLSSSAEEGAGVRSRSVSDSRHNRIETDRFKSFTYEELLKRDKLNLDIFWLKDESLEDSANLPDPDILAAEIVQDLEAALEQFNLIADDLKNKT